MCNERVTIEKRVAMETKFLIELKIRRKNGKKTEINYEKG